MVKQLAKPTRRARNVSYVQGQSPSPNVREYFYYIDHQGQVNLVFEKYNNLFTMESLGIIYKDLAVEFTLKYVNM